MPGVEGSLDSYEQALDGADELQESTESQETTTDLTPDGGTQSGQEPEQEWDGSQWVIKWKGKEVVPKTRDEVVRWAQQGYDYSQRAQKLNKRQQEIEQRSQQLAQYERMEQLFSENPAFKQQIIKLYNAAINGDVQAQDAVSDENGQIDPQIKKIIEPLQSKIDQYEQRFGQLDQERAIQEQQKADNELKSEIEQLKTDYSNHNWDVDEGDGTLIWQVMKHAYDNNFPTLKAAYRDMMFDRVPEMTKEQLMKSQQAERLKHQKAGVVSSGGSPNYANPANGKPDTSKMDWNELSEFLKTQMK